MDDYRRLDDNQHQEQQDHSSQGECERCGPAALGQPRDRRVEAQAASLR
jgi:hypothetical protein